MRGRDRSPAPTYPDCKPSGTRGLAAVDAPCRRALFVLLVPVQTDAASDHHCGTPARLRGPPLRDSTPASAIPTRSSQGRTAGLHWLNRRTALQAPPPRLAPQRASSFVAPLCIARRVGEPGSARRRHGRGREAMNIKSTEDCDNRHTSAATVRERRNPALHAREAGQRRDRSCCHGCDDAGSYLPRITPCTSTPRRAGHTTNPCASLAASGLRFGLLLDEDDDRLRHDTVVRFGFRRLWRLECSGDGVEVGHVHHQADAGRVGRIDERADIR